MKKTSPKQGYNPNRGSKPRFGRQLPMTKSGPQAPVKVARRHGPSPIPKQPAEAFPMRINKYLAMKGYTTRREADVLVAKKFVTINSRPAVLGDKVNKDDVVEVRRNNRSKSTPSTSPTNSANPSSSTPDTISTTFQYYAYNKPPGMLLETAARSLPLQEIFPAIPLDRDAEGLVILTNDRRIIDRLNNTSPASVTWSHVAENARIKEYLIRTRYPLKPNFKEKMEKGVTVGGKHKVTVDCAINIIKENLFTLRTTDNSGHIRHICTLFFAEVTDLVRSKIGTVSLGSLGANKYRPIKDEELQIFLRELGL